MMRYEHNNEVYSDLIRIYEVNLIKITGQSDIPAELIELKYFFTINSHEKLVEYVNTYQSDFAEQLVSEYFIATSDNEIVKQLEEAEYFMYKSREEAYIDGVMTGRIDGKAEGRNEGRTEGKIELLLDLGKSKAEILELLNISEERYDNIIRNFSKAV